MAPKQAIVLAELPLEDQDRMLNFLVEHHADFAFDEKNDNYSALIQIFPPGTDLDAMGRQDTRFDEDNTGSSSDSSSDHDYGPDEQALQRIAGRSRKAKFSPIKRVATCEFHGLETQTGVQRLRDQVQRSFPLLAAELREPLIFLPKHLPEAALIDFIEDVYAERFNLEAGRIQAEGLQPADRFEAERRDRTLARTHHDFTKTVFLAAQKRMGVPRLAQELIWRVAAGIQKRRRHREIIEVFARFLEDTYDDMDLLFYLSNREAARTALSAHDWSFVGDGAPNSLLGRVGRHHNKDIHGYTTVPFAERMMGGRRLPLPVIKSENERLVSARDAIIIVRAAVSPEDLRKKLLKGQVDQAMKRRGRGNLPLPLFLMLLTDDYRQARGAANSTLPLPRKSFSPRQQRSASVKLRTAFVSDRTVVFESEDEETEHGLPPDDHGTADRGTADDGAGDAFDEGTQDDDDLKSSWVPPEEVVERPGPEDFALDESAMGSAQISLGAPAEDAGAPAGDAGAPAEDAGVPAEEAVAPAEEAGAPAGDAGPKVEGRLSGDFAV